MPRGRPNITASGSGTVSAEEVPHADGEGYGITVSLGVSVGDNKSKAEVTSGTMEAYLGDDTVFDAASLALGAAQAQDSSGDDSAYAYTLAGGGSLVLGLSFCTSTADDDGTVSAYTGSDVTLPSGDVAIIAMNTTLQDATTTGIAAGLLASGGSVTATADSTVATSAALGADPTFETGASRTGALSVLATDTDENEASATGTAGAIVSGDDATANTNDKSTAAASVSGGTIYAGDVAIQATINDDYAPSDDTTNCSVLGGSGGYANTTDTTSATTNLANSTDIQASGTVDVTAQTLFAETTSGDSSTGGAGGVYNGGDFNLTATDTNVTLHGTADVNIGNSVTLSSGTDAVTNPGGIVIIASGIIASTDTVSLSTGGAIAVASDSTSLTATLDDNVTIGTGGDFTSDGNIGAGTYVQVVATNTSEIDTYGVAAVGTTTATTNVTANQNVTVGANTDMTAFGDVNLTAGEDPTGQNTSVMSGTTDAEGYVKGLIAIPSASATCELLDNTTLDVESGDSIASGQNVTAGAVSGHARRHGGRDRAWLRNRLHPRHRERHHHQHEDHIVQRDH